MPRLIDPPSGWEEPGQRPEFQEITVVLKGSLRVEFKGGHLDDLKETICRSASWSRSGRGDNPPWRASP